MLHTVKRKISVYLFKRNYNFLNKIGEGPEKVKNLSRLLFRAISVHISQTFWNPSRDPVSFLDNIHWEQLWPGKVSNVGKLPRTAAIEVQCLFTCSCSDQRERRGQACLQTILYVIFPFHFNPISYQFFFTHVIFYQWLGRSSKKESFRVTPTLNALRKVPMKQFMPL
jgi:hypothetical protein